MKIRRPGKLRLSLFLSALCLLSCLCGCLEKVPLGERAIVLALGLDRNGGEYEASIQVDMAAGGVESAGKNISVIHAKGKTITELFTTAAVSQGRQLFIGSMQLVVVGKDTAQEGIGDILSFLNSDHQLDPTLQITVAQGEAGKLIDAVEENPDLTAETLLSRLKNAQSTGWVPQSRLMDLTAAVYGENRTACAALLTLTDPDEKIIVAEDSSLGDDPLLTLPVQAPSDGSQPSASQQQAQNPPDILAGGMGLFYGDRLEQMLDADKTRGLQWLQNQVKATSISLSDPQIGNVALLSHRERAKIDVQLMGDNPVFDLQLQVETQLQERPVFTSFDEGKRVYAQALCEQTLRLEIEEALSASLRAGYDPLGFSLLMKQKYPRFYEENRGHWEQIMENSGYPVTVRCSIAPTHGAGE